jgi:metal-responsive CopG/Arc/MetJ family transcriptional regulator
MCKAERPYHSYGILAVVKLAKRTYSLPPDLVQRFETRLAPGDRSRFLAKLIEEWLAERERDELRRQVIEGCVEMGGLYQEIEREWAGVSDEVWRDTQ